MLIAIDPDVFDLALTGDQKHEVQLIKWVYSRLSDYDFAFDREKELDKEYARLLNDNQGSVDLESTSAKLLQYFITARESAKRFSSKRAHQLDYFLTKKKCDTPVEPLLIGMASNAPRLGLKLLLAAEPGKRERRLYDSGFRESIKKEVSKIRVVFADNYKTETIYPDLQTTDPKSHLDRLYEKQVESLIRDYYGCSRCYQKTPAAIEDGPGEIDVYGFQQENPRKIWIAECKLRRKNPENLIDADDVARFLKEKIPAIQEYEKAQSDEERVEMDIFVVSNARNMTSDIWDLTAKIVGQCQETGAKVRFRFLQTILSKNFVTNQRSRILVIEEYEPTQEDNSGWSGRFIKTLEIK
jgi:hypothetical protein